MTPLEEPCSRMLAYKPPRIAMSLLAIGALTQFALPIDWPELTRLLIPGITVAVLGFCIMIRAWWLFRQHETAICPTAKTTVFITQDIYGLTRNPMYLGMVFILLGVALGAGSLLLYFVAGVYALILDHVFCRFEERKLLHQFGRAYADYAAQVRRWV